MRCRVMSRCLVLCDLPGRCLPIRQFTCSCFFVCRSLASRCFALCSLLGCRLTLRGFTCSRFLVCRSLTGCCLALYGLLGGCLPLRRFTGSRFFVCRSLASCGFARRVPAGSHWVRRTNLIMRREVIPRQHSLRPRHGFSFRRPSNLRRRHATLTPTHP